MKITVTSETTGTEVVLQIINQLAASSLKIDAKENQIKAQVVSKAGDWVDFPADKIRFVFSS